MIRVDTKFTFTGHFNVDVESEAEAREIVRLFCFMNSGEISASAWDAEVKDWEFPMHPEKEIIKTTDETRISLKRQIKANSRKGSTPVVVWGRDCDNAEATTLHAIDSTIDAYQELYWDVESNAEGPFSVTIISPEEADEFHPLFRDRAAEQAGY